MDDPFTIGAAALNDFQIGILDDCLNKGSGGMSCPMGSGKTLVAILLSLQQTEDIILIVVAKNLIASWEFEIQKFFGHTLKYEVLHPDSLKKKLMYWSPKKTTRIVLTTPDIVSKHYKENSVSQSFIRYVPHPENPFVVTKYYNQPTKPFLNHTRGGGYIFSKRWGCLIVDEMQCYTNINSYRCQGLAAVCSKYRWALSGTLFNEPKVERILGYYLILDIPDTPRNLPEMSRLLFSSLYKGLSETIVHRQQNTTFTPPTVVEEIISHTLSAEEAKLYTSMKLTLQTLRMKAVELQAAGDVAGARRFSSYLLAMITYIRQSLVCPLIPISSIAIDMADYKNKSELSTVLMESIEKLDLEDWLGDVDSICSTRMKEALTVINKHENDRIVLFSCFRSSIDVLTTFLPKDRPVMTIKANMNTQKRGQVIKDFEKTTNGILLLTYELGAEGLNLQCSSTVMLLDFWWNSAKTKQAIARVVRYGQKALTVNVYFFTSNTGLEKGLFEKQHAKQIVLEELQHGSWKTKIPRLSMKQIIQLIDKEENTTLLQKVIS
uniref:DEAD/SNF2-like helicase n=1 Tax=Marseillevirus LCMAC201 TaxID=2506605 RepID=A0A481YW86_9VIRU|nr:MAG: DEAD/SNF2-like helicase [Marseillevirus LCMAC201]